MEVAKKNMPSQQFQSATLGALLLILKAYKSIVSHQTIHSALKSTQRQAFKFLSHRIYKNGSHQEKHAFAKVSERTTEGTLTQFESTKIKSFSPNQKFSTQVKHENKFPSSSHTKSTRMEITKKSMPSQQFQSAPLRALLLTLKAHKSKVSHQTGNSALKETRKQCFKLLRTPRKKINTEADRRRRGSLTLGKKQCVPKEPTAPHCGLHQTLAMGLRETNRHPKPRGQTLCQHKAARGSVTVPEGHKITHSQWNPC